MELGLHLGALALGILKAAAGLLELLGELVLDVLEVVQLDLDVVELLHQLVVLHLEALALGGQVVDVLVQLLHLHHPARLSSARGARRRGRGPCC